MTIITSKDNNRIKKARKLLTKKYRETSYLVAGWHLFEEAQSSGADIVQIFATPEAADRVAHLGQVVQVSEEVLKSLSELPSPQGIVAEVAMPDQTGLDLSQGRWLLLEDVQDPGNVGTMIRTADAAGLAGVLLTPGCADIYNQKTLRAMQGSHFHLPIYRLSLEELLTLEHPPILASSLDKGSVDYRQVDWPGSAILAMGNEGQGISQALVTASQQLVHIPMPGQAESLNVAVACGILVFQSVGL